MALITLADVRDFGVDETLASDDRVNAGIAAATEKIINFTGQTWGEVERYTLMIDGVTKPDIALPTPFSNVTAVSVTLDGAPAANAITLETDDYEIRDWGVKVTQFRLRDADGFPLFFRPFHRPVRAVTVAVTARFGNDTTPQTIKDAAIILAARASTRKLSDLAPVAIARIQVEGYLVMYKNAADFGTSPTTGDAEVDLMLGGYVAVAYMVD